MQDELAVDFGVELKNRDWGAGDPAFRCGLPLRGNGRPIRDESPWVELLASVAAGSRIGVSWLPEVSWRKRIRVSKR